MKKFLFLVQFVLPCLLMLTACSCMTDQDIHMHQTISIPVVKTTFTNEELLADYDQCWEILEENYPFFPVLEKHGIDVQGVKESYRQTLMDRVTDVNGFFVLLQQMFGSMENFAHLSVMDQGIYQFLSYYGEAGDPYFDPQTAATYAALPEVVAGDGDQPGKEVEANYYAHLKAAYFHFRTFAYPHVESEDSVVGAYLAQLEEENLPVEHVIIDITGNSGGNSWNVDQDIIAPLGGGTWKNTIYFADSPINREWLIPALDTAPKPLTGASTEPAFTKELGMTHSWTFTMEYPSAEKIYAEGAQRWLLIDEGCYSASESFIGFCKKSGWATIVGRRGRGDGDLLGSLPAHLDQTGLLIRFSTTSRANADGTLNAEKGETPDYLCKPNESPLRKCMELIQAEVGDGE